MTRRLYYNDPNLLAFTSRVIDIREREGRTEVALEETAFYPTSGGQPFDTGTLSFNTQRVRVVDVHDDGDDGAIWHVLAEPAAIKVGESVTGEIDAARRLDHRQQHTGQHLLSAMLWQHCQAATVSFHMGDETCTIDVDNDTLTDEQIAEAREEANRIIAANLPLSIDYCSAEAARARGVRKIAAGLDHVRLIEIPGVDLNACGGTHVNATGEIGCIFTRKVEKVRQGKRIEFVCGLRAVRIAARDYDELRSAGDVLSSGVWTIADQIGRALADAKTQSKRMEEMQRELAQVMAEQMVANAPEILVQRFTNRDADFVQTLARNLVRIAPRPLVVLFAVEQPTPTLIFARSEHDEVKQHSMGKLLKEVLAKFGTRGGGSDSLARGGVNTAADLDHALEIAKNLSAQR
jgi:alanyl-tRNA synthetase